MLVLLDVHQLTIGEPLPAAVDSCLKETAAGGRIILLLIAAIDDQQSCLSFDDLIEVSYK